MIWFKLITISLAAAVFIALLQGNKSIVLNFFDIKSHKFKCDFKGLTVVHIADLHNNEFGKNNIKLLDKIKGANPDLIVITGDLIDSRLTDAKNAMNFINGASKIADIYYVPGNHEARLGEYYYFKEQLINSGVFVLENRCVKRENIFIAGICDPSFFKKTGKSDCEIVRGEIEKLNLSGEEFTLLLSHRPELFDLYRNSRADLTLCGHAHGGQIRVPFLGGLFAPNQGIFPRYTSGIYASGKTKMIVSRGIGGSIFPFRINNRPEIVVIRLSAER